MAPAEARAGFATGIRHAAEYRLLQAALAGFDRLPIGTAAALARRLGRTWFALDRRRRRVAISNVLRAGFAGDQRQATDLARRSAEHFALVVLEALRSEEILDREPAEPEGGAEPQPACGGVELRIDPAARALLEDEAQGMVQPACGGVELRIDPAARALLEDEAQGMVLSSGHFGNWEIGGQVLSRFKPVAGIARPMNNPRVERLVQQRKPRYRFRPIPKYSGEPRRFLEVLRQGEALALLTDQHARSGGVPVELFGHPVSTYTTSAMLHLVARVPLCFAACRRVAPLRFELVVSPPIEHRRSGDRRADVQAILRRLNAMLEEQVRLAPDQYVWGHRFWR
ncbi:MAG: hypothetical protein DWQ36_18590 [Acidobacteria bacterium]|nr:MAG: hypothetical protein DWQ30_11440 [Acidobacteriota bacterium]REK03878.1 MAG: hypothetical protein DWQ36_18590 [Acidobacteriota bacterium]